MPLTHDKSLSTEPNPFLIHLMGIREWLEEKLDGPEHGLWFVPRGVDKKSAVKIELLAIDTMLEHIYAQMDAGRTVEEIRVSGQALALRERKTALMPASDTSPEPGNRQKMLGDIYHRMYLTFKIL